MDNFFARVRSRSWPWPEGREDLHWHILPPRGEINRLVRGYSTVTHHQGLIPVPVEWTHVTVLHSAPLSEVTADQVEEVTTRVRKACARVAPFELTVGRPSVGTVAIECPAWPGPLARPLWQITAQASRDVWQDAYPTLPAKYYPHLSVAYAGDQASEADRTDLKVALSDCGDVGTVTFTVDKLWLVAQQHDGRHITWRVLDQVLLGR